VGFSISLALQRTFDVVARPASASPASGMASKHALQQQDVVERAFAR
jgi:2-oxoglutarate dehydrogenase E1 component